MKTLHIPDRATQIVHDVEIAEESEPVMLVNMSERPKAVALPIKRKANNALHAMGNYSDRGVPLAEIFEKLEALGLIPVQEDGCRWSGFLCGAAECGSDKAREQVALFPLAIYDDASGCHRLSKLGLCLSWGTLNRQNGTRRWEFVAYVN